MRTQSFTLSGATLVAENGDSLDLTKLTKGTLFCHSRSTNRDYRIELFCGKQKMTLALRGSAAAVEESFPSFHRVAVRCLEHVVEANEPEVSKAHAEAPGVAGLDSGDNSGESDSGSASSVEPGADEAKKPSANLSAAPCPQASGPLFHPRGGPGFRWFGFAILIGLTLLGVFTIIAGVQGQAALVPLGAVMTVFFGLVAWVAAPWDQQLWSAEQALSYVRSWSV